ncbi:MAG: hypothetical protein QM808_08960 [Steroidobacteraceae bacterium]
MSSAPHLGSQPEVVAVVLPDGTPEASTTRDFVATGTMLLVRHADGRMSLESAGGKAALPKQSTATGCFRKSKPILDPVSREVMGYEMEMIELSLAS